MGLGGRGGGGISSRSDTCNGCYFVERLLKKKKKKKKRT